MKKGNVLNKKANSLDNGYCELDLSNWGCNISSLLECDECLFDICQKIHSLAKTK